MSARHCHHMIRSILGFYRIVQSHELRLTFLGYIGFSQVGNVDH
jgi:hypothetical protein